jgi:hypothetical protein
VRSVTLNLPAESGVLVGNGGCVTMHSVRETTGSAPAVYRLWDSDSNQGQLLLTVGLASSASAVNSFAVHTLVFRTGLYYELVDGEIEGQVSAQLEHDCEEANNLWSKQMLLELAYNNEF